jgi:hypothetical protein
VQQGQQGCRDPLLLPPQHKHSARREDKVLHCMGSRWWVNVRLASRLCQIVQCRPAARQAEGSRGGKGGTACLGLRLACSCADSAVCSSPTSVHPWAAWRCSQMLRVASAGRRTRRAGDKVMQAAQGNQ